MLHILVLIPIKSRHMLLHADELTGRTKQNRILNICFKMIFVYSLFTFLHRIENILARSEKPKSCIFKYIQDTFLKSDFENQLSDMLIR